MDVFAQIFEFTIPKLSMDNTCHDGLPGKGTYLHLDEGSNFVAEVDPFQVLGDMNLPEEFCSELIKLNVKFQISINLSDKYFLSAPDIAGA